MPEGKSLVATQSLEPAIRRVPLDYLTIYDVTEDELDALETGSPVSVYMNALVFCFSTALSFLVTLVTAEIKSVRTFNVFVIVTVVGFLASAVLGLLWLQARGSAKNVAQKIRDRLQQHIGTRADDPIIIDQINATTE